MSSTVSQFGQNQWLVDEMYQRFRKDPSSVDSSWHDFFEANPDVAQKVRDGKVQAAGALIGQVMKEMKGQADAAKARSIILEQLGQA